MIPDNSPHDTLGTTDATAPFAAADGAGAEPDDPPEPSLRRQGSARVELGGARQRDARPHREGLPPERVLARLAGAVVFGAMLLASSPRPAVAARFLSSPGRPGSTPDAALLAAADPADPADPRTPPRGAGHAVGRTRWEGGARALPPEVEGSIRRGLDFLTRNMSEQGAFSRDYGVAVTALGGMALLGYGVEYNRGPYGRHLARAVAYLLDRDRSTDLGYFDDKGADRPSKMHGHAYAVLFLAQVVGGVRDPRVDAAVRTAIRKGIDVIARAQTVDGGWGYTTDSHRADEASITVCCLQALRAAKDAGFQVPAIVIEGALRYLRACANEDGSFRYSLRGRSRKSYELTAAAVSTLDAAGQYTGEIHERGVQFMLDRLDDHRANPWAAAETYPFYGNFYAAQVYYQLGGERWRAWWQRSRPRLVREQRGDGSWTSPQFGDAYATTMAVLILEIPLGYLPIFER